MWFILFVVLFFQILLDTFEDTIRKDGKDLHFIQSMHLLLWLVLCGMFFTGIIQPFTVVHSSLSHVLFIGTFVLAYALIRFVFFDILWCIQNDKWINYYGKSGLYAKIMSYLQKKVPLFDYFVIVLRGVSAWCGTYLLHSLVK